MTDELPPTKAPARPRKKLKRPRVARIGARPPTGQTAEVLEFVMDCLGMHMGRAEVQRSYRAAVEPRRWKPVSDGQLDDYIRSARDRMQAEVDEARAGRALAEALRFLRQEQRAFLALASRAGAGVGPDPRPDLGNAISARREAVRVEMERARLLGLVSEAALAQAAVNVAIITGDDIRRGIRAHEEDLAREPDAKRSDGGS